MAAGLFRWRAGATALAVAAMALAAAALQSRSAREPLPAAPRIVWGALFCGSGLIVSLVVLVGQSLHAQLSGTSGPPLPIWPLTSKFLWIAGALAFVGGTTSLLGLHFQRRHREEFGGARLAAMAILASWSTLALILLCYFTGHGFPLGG